MRLHDYLEYYARETPDHPFAEMEGTVVSYAEANRRANRFGHGLLRSGLSKGDRFSYLSKNTIDMAIMFLAASKVGVVPVPLNYRLAPREWLYILNDAGSKALLCENEFSQGIDTVRDELTELETFVSLDAEVADWTAYDAWLSDCEDDPDVDVSEDEQLYQMYTSGTTGLPKGAMLSHRSIDCNMLMFSRAMNLTVGEERFLVVAPLYHAAAGMTLKTAVSNASTVVIHREFEPAEVVRSIAEDRITRALLVPAMIQACLVGVPDAAQRSYPDLRTVAYGASPIAVETLRQAMDTFKCDFVQLFGMTETTAAATALGAAEHRRALAGETHLLKSAGRAVLGTQIRIVDEEDQEVPRGTVGEIIVKGPQVMMGYWNLPEATEKSLKNGWMHTGDAAYMDEEGLIYIQDRIKDMIVSGAENIYPAEIEAVLFEHPAVADAAVIGIPSERWGETVLAFLALKDGHSLAMEDMVEFCRPRLAGFKIPRRIEFLEEVPRNASGKVLKKDLREPFWEGIERRVS